MDNLIFKNGELFTVNLLNLINIFLFSSLRILILPSKVDKDTLLRKRRMKYTQALLEELNLLLQFNLDNTSTGIKVHKEASTGVQDAIKRLHHKKLCTLSDGGYLTAEGIKLAEQANLLLKALSV